MKVLYTNFWEDYPDMSGKSTFIPKEGAEGAANLWNFLYANLKYIWAILFGFTLISTVIALVRLAISADDIPQKKAVAKHDLAAALVMLAIMGGTPALAWLIIQLLNLLYI